MKFHAVIFDMDGTIIATEHIWLKASLEVLKRRNVPLSPEFIQTLETNIKGVNLYDSCQIIKKMGNLSEPLEEIVAERQALGKAFYQEGIHYISGFEIFHNKLKNLQIPTAIGTNGTYTLLKVVDTKLNLQQHFQEHMYSAQSVDNKFKPDPAIFFYAAKKLGIDAKKCIVIEDSTPGVAAAKAAGMLCIGINTARDKRFTEDADIQVDTYDEIDIEKILF